ncbi:hypothetical protein ACJX0J_030401 [Zea mays]
MELYVCGYGDMYYFIAFTIYVILPKFFNNISTEAHLISRINNLFEFLYYLHREVSISAIITISGLSSTFLSIQIPLLHWILLLNNITKSLVKFLSSMTISAQFSNRSWLIVAHMFLTPHIFPQEFYEHKGHFEIKLDNIDVAMTDNFQELEYTWGIINIKNLLSLSKLQRLFPQSQYNTSISLTSNSKSIDDCDCHVKICLHITFIERILYQLQTPF